jgi:hypothetical protein
MKPMLDNRFLRACAALGTLGATFTVALDVNQAAANTNPGPFVWGPAARLSATPAANQLGLPSTAHFTAATPFGIVRPVRRHARVDKVASAIKRMVGAGDRIAKLPYVYGGGHGSFTSAGYDCSGSVSYVLHAARLLDTPMTSGSLESYGLPGPGKHVTIYANGGHAWMTINGRRFDTIALQETGTRWSSTISSSAGYVVRHPRGF